MAKPATLQIRLVSTADTGYFYVTKKNPRTKPEKLEVMKYDPRARKHVLTAGRRGSGCSGVRHLRLARRNAGTISCSPTSSACFICLTGGRQPCA